MKNIIFLSLILAFPQVQGQFFKNLGIKAGCTNSSYEWNFRASSAASNSERVDSEKATGLAIILTSDLIDKNFWGLSFSTGWIKRNAGQKYFFYHQQIPYVLKWKYETEYLLINPAFKGKLPLGKILNLYGQLGLRSDILLSHSSSVESFYNNRIQRDSDLKKLSYGITLSPGIEFPFSKGVIRLEYTRFVDFNNIVYVKGPRLDGFGDAGYYFKVKAHTVMYTASIAMKW